MSRYEWSREGKTYSIGWDAPLKTYFAQIHNDGAKTDAEYCELWLGHKTGEFVELTDLIEKLPAPVRESVCDDLQFHLLADKFWIENPGEMRPLPPHVTRRF